MDASLPARLGDDAEREWLALLDGQAGIIDREQARRLGFTDRQITHRVNSDRWQRLHQGVYATFSGPVSRDARLWAAIRWAGKGAMLSHETAAELYGIVDSGNTIHVTVPSRRRPAQLTPAPGIVVHRADRSDGPFSGPFTLPRTTAADTVLDLATTAPTFDSAYAWIARAVSGQLVTVEALRAELAQRTRVRWREWLSDSLEEAGDGVHSALERRYARDVARAHGLPESEHQARRQLNGAAHAEDNWYPGYWIAVEIDGPAYHRSERVPLGRDRDNANLALDDVRTFRFGPVAVTEQACETAAMVAVTLQRNGWPGPPRPCRRSGCALKSSLPAHAG
jgi:hypothetical protein